MQICINNNQTFILHRKISKIQILLTHHLLEYNQECNLDILYIHHHLECSLEFSQECNLEFNKIQVFNQTRNYIILANNIQIIKWYSLQDINKMPQRSNLFYNRFHNLNLTYSNNRLPILMFPIKYQITQFHTTVSNSLFPIKISNKFQQIIRTTNSNINYSNNPKLIIK